MASPSFGAAMPDAWITTKAKMALLTTEGVGSTAINVDTIDGRVTLHGKADSELEKQKAEQTVKAIEGVSEVRNLIVVVSPAKQDAVQVADNQIQDNVEKALDADQNLADSDIAVSSVNAGVVVLSGSATTLSDQLRAIQTARAVPGVRRVASQITGPDKITDAEIWYDTDKQAGDAPKGSVERAGDAVKSSGKAVGDAAKTTGNAVKDAGSSATGTMSDAWITSAAKVRLIANADTPAMEINVDTADGVVTLFGIVPTNEAKRAAEDEVRKVSGVKSIDNQLRVVAESKQERVEAKDDQIMASVNQRLDNDPLTDDDITVAVKDGVVRLTGEVDSQSERMRALTLARSTAGVRSVIDELKIDSDQHAQR